MTGSSEQTIVYEEGEDATRLGVPASEIAEEAERQLKGLE